MVETVLLALHHELSAVPGQEGYGMLWLYIFVVLLPVQLGLLLSVAGIVADETAVVLVAV